MIKRKHGGISNNKFIDFSAPTNPLGPLPISDKILRSCIFKENYIHYPDYKKLKRSLSDYWNVDEDYILPVNGSDEALTIIPLSFKSKQIAILEPNFGDFEIMSKNLRIKLIRPLIKLDASEPYIDSDEIVKLLKNGKVPLLIISRPNNPTGYCINKKDIEFILSNTNSLLVIDEAFVELSDCDLMKESEDYIIIRSQTKTFSTPGLRLGEIITTNKKILNKIESSLQAWPIDSITSCFYSNLLKETEAIKKYLSNANDLISKERSYIENNLNVKTYKSRTSFILIKHEKLPNPIFKRKLMDKGIYIRDASTFYGLNKFYSRISVKNHEENEKLVNSINGVLNGK